MTSLCVCVCVCASVNDFTLCVCVQDLTDVALMHSWALYVMAALEDSDFLALKNLLVPVNSRQQVTAPLCVCVCDC